MSVRQDLVMKEPYGDFSLLLGKSDFTSSFIRIDEELWICLQSINSHAQGLVSTAICSLLLTWHFPSVPCFWV
ncbi:hypothetical protein V9K46_002518 [Vibrio parahaemolyticus]